MTSRSKTARAKAIDKAIIEAKKHYGKQCLCCGSHYVDGAHIVPRDYKKSLGIGHKLATVWFNIVPLCRLHHNYIDEKKVFGRIKFLFRMCDYEKIKFAKNYNLLRLLFKEIR